MKVEMEDNEYGSMSKESKAIYWASGIVFQKATHNYGLEVLRKMSEKFIDAEVIKKSWEEVRLCAALIREGKAKIVEVTRRDGSVYISINWTVTYWQRKKKLKRYSH